jgi:hypothetical protein
MYNIKSLETNAVCTDIQHQLNPVCWADFSDFYPKSLPVGS